MLQGAAGGFGDDARQGGAAASRQQHGVYASGSGGAQASAEIAGVLDAVEHDYEGRFEGGPAGFEGSLRCWHEGAAFGGDALVVAGESGSQGVAANRLGRCALDANAGLFGCGDERCEVFRAAAFGDEQAPGFAWGVLQQGADGVEAEQPIGGGRVRLGLSHYFGALRGNVGCCGVAFLRWGPSASRCGRAAR